MEDDATTDHDAVIEFATYEDFLDSQISSTDLYYLEVIYCYTKKRCHLLLIDSKYFLRMKS
jgi:hypothetical protein